MEKILHAAGIAKRYKDVVALQPTDITIERGKIYGLIGRNGAGKTTLLSLLTAQNPVSEGVVTYGGEPVWENEKAIGDICFSRELSPMIAFGQNTYKGKHYLEMARCYYPHWDEEYAKRLIADFEFNVKKKIYKLSKGMMSMLTIIIAMASRAPITILDEPVAGLDVAMRDRFYRILLDDYEKTNRTFIVSTHIIEEAAGIFEDVIFLDKGKLIENGNATEFVSRFAYLEGKDEAVEAAAKGLKVWHTDGIGRHKILCVEGTPAQLEAIEGVPEVEISAVPLHKIFVYVTGGEKEANLA